MSDTLYWVLKGIIKTIQCWKDSLFQQMVLRKLDSHMQKKKKQDHSLTLYTKIAQNGLKI